MQINQCPICLDKYSILSKITCDHGDCRIECLTCGIFGVSEEAWEDFLDPETGHGSRLTTVQRSSISHKVRTARFDENSIWPKIYCDFLNRFETDGFPRPNPAEQAKNLIQFIGNEISKTGERIKHIPDDIFTLIGSPTPEFASELAEELISAGFLEGKIHKTTSEISMPHFVRLTFRGWEKYEAEKYGRFAGKTGFIAMKFGDKVLDPLVQNTMKPIIKSEIGYDLVDLREVAQAGVIDNIMRAQIRDSAFVLVDLTHDNSGAYWEAGYAEGLGKPVIYLCEKSKFDHAKTHFDTNHCTTVIWDLTEIDKFKNELIATLRRSLNLFS
jgi:nucleoside 2-deoxyribosyltransferase